MNYKVLFIISFVFFFAGCEQNNLNKNLINQEIMTRYKNTGFALVYQETPLYVNLASNFMPQTQGPGADNFDPAQTMIFERPVRTGMSRRFFR